MRWRLPEISDDVVAAARPPVAWLAVFATSFVVLIALWRQLGWEAMLLWSYLAACSPDGWRLLSALRRGLGFSGRGSLVMQVIWTPMVGAVASPVVVGRALVALWRLRRGAMRRRAAERHVIPLPRRGGR